MLPLCSISLTLGLDAHFLRIVMLKRSSEYTCTSSYTNSNLANARGASFDMSTIDEGAQLLTLHGHEYGH